MEYKHITSENHKYSIIENDKNERYVYIEGLKLSSYEIKQINEELDLYEYMDFIKREWKDFCKAYPEDNDKEAPDLSGKDLRDLAEEMTSYVDSNYEFEHLYEKFEELGGAMYGLKKDIMDYCLTTICDQVKHEYDTPEEFEDKYGKTDTVEDVVSLYLELKCSEDVENTVSHYIETYPEYKEYIAELFEVDMDFEKEEI